MKTQLFRGTLRHMDLPGHEEVERIVRIANLVAPSLGALGSALMFLVSLLWLGTPSQYAITAAVSVLALGLFGVFLFSRDDERSFQWIRLGFAVVGTLVGAYFAYGNFGLVPSTGAEIFGFLWRMSGGALVGVATSYVLVIAAVCLPFLGRPFAYVVSPIFMRVILMRLRARFPAWRGTNGQCILKFNWEGLSDIRDGALQNPRVFVMYPKQRRNGNAQEEGIKKLTKDDLIEIRYPTYRRSTGTSAAGAAAVGAALVSDGKSSGGGGYDGHHDTYNPLDLGAYNPATGLPTTGGLGTPDIGGNNYGHVDSNW